VVPEPGDLNEDLGTSAEPGSSDVPDLDSVSATEDRKSSVPDLDSVTKTEDRKSVYRPPETKAFDGERWREGTRTFLSFALFISIGLTQLLVSAFVAAPILLPFFVASEKHKQKGDDSKVVKLGDSTFIYVVKNEDEGKDGKELITLIWTSQVTLIGGALGFYFAANKEKI
jgi:hypothetical protein